MGEQESQENSVAEVPHEESLSFKGFHAQVNIELTNQVEWEAKYTYPITTTRLAALLAQGDIEELLRVEGAINRRRFTTDAAEIVGRFLPHYRRERGKLYRAPQMLREFIEDNQPRTFGDHLKRSADISEHDLNSALAKLIAHARKFDSNAVFVFMDGDTPKMVTIPIKEREILNQQQVEELLDAPVEKDVEQLGILVSGVHRRWRRKDIIEYINALPTVGE